VHPYVTQHPQAQQMMQSMMSNPQMMEQMINSDPRMRAALEANPAMRERMTDPTFLRQAGVALHPRVVSDWLHVRPQLDLWVALTPGGCQIVYMCDQNSTYGLHSLLGGFRLWLHGP
jgi:hypothetical protein